jgi:hypothetical protein
MLNALHTRRLFLRLSLLFSATTAFSASAADAEFDLNHPSAKAALAVQQDVTPAMMRTDGVLGTAIGGGAGEQAVLVVYIDREAQGAAAAMRAIPRELRGVPVRIEQTDKFRAFANTAKQVAPIQLGTSGGWYYDLANGYCCGGTLGSLIEANGTRYILSNYHVLEADIAAGGNNLVAATGQAVVQPGLLDVACNVANSQSVGTLVKLSSLPASNVDAAIAQVTPGMVRTDGAILGIGTISKNTLAAKVRQNVKKSGRTTGLTTSKVSGLNATISVAYSSECGGGQAFTKTFTGQIVVTNSNSAFLRGGDSGSLLVENTATNPRAIGLLFAGSSTSAIANPIGPVLQFIGDKLGAPATMVGN